MEKLLFYGICGKWVVVFFLVCFECLIFKCECILLWVIYRFGLNIYIMYIKLL